MTLLICGFAALAFCGSSCGNASDHPQSAMPVTVPDSAQHSMPVQPLDTSVQAPMPVQKIDSGVVPK